MNHTLQAQEALVNHILQAQEAVVDYTLWVQEVEVDHIQRGQEAVVRKFILNLLKFINKSYTFNFVHSLW